jgi:hypothetical protein
VKRPEHQRQDDFLAFVHRQAVEMKAELACQEAQRDDQRDASTAPPVRAARGAWSVLSTVLILAALLAFGIFVGGIGHFASGGY